MPKNAEQIILFVIRIVSLALLALAVYLSLK